MNNSVLLGGLALLLLWGVWGITSKLAVREVGLQIVIWSQVASLALFPLYFVFFKDLLPLKISATGVGFAFISGLLGTAGALVLYLLLRDAPASVVIPISALYPIITVLLAAVFLQEALTVTRIAGVILGAAAVWLLSS